MSDTNALKRLTSVIHAEVVADEDVPVVRVLQLFEQVLRHTDVDGVL